MGHSATKPLILLSLIAVTGACSDDNDDGTNDGAATAEESGSGARSGSSATGGRASTATTAGRGGNTASAGRGGNTASGGSSGSSVSVIAGRGAASTAGRGGTGATTSTTPTAGAGGSAGGSAGSAGQAAQVVRDEEIVAILTAANNAEVQQGNVAATKAVSPAVRTYAQDLVNLHTAAQTRLNGVITAANLTPAESATSSDLTKTSSGLVTKLQAADLEAFDMTFIQAQIDQHRQVLTLIDERLLPSVKSDVLRLELASTREAVVQHLNRGRAIAVTLELSVDAGPEADAGL
jgi:putative membrane protein